MLAESTKQVIPLLPSVYNTLMNKAVMADGYLILRRQKIRYHPSPPPSTVYNTLADTEVTCIHHYTIQQHLKLQEAGVSGG